MPEGRIGFVWNPSKIDRGDLERAVEAAVGQDADVLWLETSPDDPGQGPAREALAAGCAVVVAAGGDGTVRAVAEVLAGSGVPLGIVPQGTGNLLARNLDVPLGDLAAAVDRAVTGEDRAIDIGWVDVEQDGERSHHAFVVMVGFGLDAQMLAETDDDLKSKAGWLAYVDALGRAVASTEVVDALVAIDDEPEVTVPAHTMIVGNCGTIQAGLRILPDARPDDGSLDVLVVSADSPLQWLETVRSVVWDNGLRRVFSRNGDDEEAVDTGSTRHRQAVSVRVQLPAPQPFEIDGEDMGAVSEFIATIQPGALVTR